MATWTFEDSESAYGACQCRDDIKNGDTLIIESEQVVGLAGTWPVAVTLSRVHNGLHTVNADYAAEHGIEDATQSTKEQIAAAVEAAQARGWAVDPIFIQQEKVMTKTVANVLAIEPETNEFYFITEAAVDHVHQGIVIVRVAEDLQALSGPQAVALYNRVITEHQAPVKRFSDKTAAAQRLWVAFQDYKRRADFEAAERAATGEPEVTKEQVADLEVQMKKAASDVANKARDRAKPANIKDVPAPAPKAPRRSGGVNLAPMKKVYACRAGTKQAKLIDLLSRPQGATFKELHAAMTSPEFDHLKPWAEVTTRSALGWDVHHVKGYGIRTTKRENGEDCYRLTYPAGMNAPLPHQPRKTKAQG